jgi:hypothetical protein
MLKPYTKVRLKTGELGVILEDFNDGSFLAEISLITGILDTTEIKSGDIASYFTEVEEPYTTA